MLSVPIFIYSLLLIPAGAAQRFELVVGLPHQNVELLDEMFWNISTPGNAAYLRFMNTEDLASIIGAPEGQLLAARHWLEGLGAESISISPLQDTITAEFQSDTIRGRMLNNGLPADKPPIEHDFLLRRAPRNETALKTPEKSHIKQDGYHVGALYSIGNIKKAYGIPVDRTSTNASTQAMVWGPGTFGYSVAGLKLFKAEQCPLLNTDKVQFDTQNHGEAGGDNFGEGTLDVHMISSFGLNASILVSNTNTSASTEEGQGFGQAMLDFAVGLSSRPTVPHVLSISLGSLSAASCEKLCAEAVKRGHTLSQCNKFLQEQRQVCMFLSTKQVARINSAFKILGTRGVSIFGSSGDGGSHFSFGPFSGISKLASDLNEISCEFQFPVFPTTSPYVTSVGGTDWKSFDSSSPEPWSGSGGGFSWEFASPAFQQSTVQSYLSSVPAASLPPSSSYNASGRAYPDISAVAVDGTSQSSPIVAGIFTLLTDHRLNQGLPPLGFLGPRLYQVAKTFPGEAFEDVSGGNSKTTCENGFGSRTAGWDPVTGFGRPMWDGILKHFGQDDEI